MSETSFLKQGLDAHSDLPAEIRSLMGVYVLYWRIADCVESTETEPPLAKNERRLLVKLNQPRRMGDLARDLQATPSSVTALADGLEDKGLLMRARDPDDRRAWRLQLTPQGDDLRNCLMAEAAQMFREVSGLDETDISKFADLVTRIADNIITQSGLPEGLNS